MTPRAVTLDAGGTLLAVAEPVGRTYARVAARHGIHIAAADAEVGFRRALAIAPPLAFPGASPVRLRDHERAWWSVVVRRSLGDSETGVELAAVCDELFAHYAGAAAWRLFPEVRDTLAALRAGGVRVGVVSNFDTRLGPLLATLGITDLVDVVLPSTLAGCAKPDPTIFHDALTRLGVAPADALHAGDEVVADVLGARGAGLRAVFVRRDGPAPPLPEDVPVLTSLAELPRLLDGG